MTNNKLAFISFKPNKDGFSSYLALEGFDQNCQDPEDLIKRASKLYEKYIHTLRNINVEIQNIRSSPEVIPARIIWELGDQIFKLIEALTRLSLQIDGLYEHLVRDLNVKRKWLEKVIIFRRYLPQKKYVPISLNWGQCEKGTRKVAIELFKKE